MNSQIHFGFQNWNVEYSWWAPNTIAADFIVNGKKVLPATHGIQWFDCGTFKDWATDRNDALNHLAIKTDFLYDYDNIVYSHLPTLRGKKYIFPVLIRDTDYFKFHKDIGFDLVDPIVFEDVRANRCRIVFVFPLEGTSGDLHHALDFEILNNWCKKVGLQKHQVYFIHSNHLGNKLSAGMNFTYIPIDLFIRWVPGTRQHISNFEPVDNQNLFLSYNRRPRPHRTIMMCELIRANLMGRGIKSYYGDNKKNVDEKMISFGRPDLEFEAQVLNSLIPLEIDMDLGDNNPAWSIVEEHYKRTFLSLIPETLYGNDTLFFSEKTWKTLAVGHPFMLLSSPGMLQNLRQRGYYTYGTWWDEGYDVIIRLSDRIRHIVNELKRLSEFSKEQLMNMRIMMEPVIKHNQNLFNIHYGRFNSLRTDDELHFIIENIWNSF